MLNMFRLNVFEVLALFSIRGALGQFASVFIAVYWDGAVGWARRFWTILTSATAFRTATSGAASSGF